MSREHLCSPAVDKRPFDIDLAVQRIEQVVRSLPKAALFELAAEGFDSAFEQLAACMISIRTLDEVTLPTARRLFARARTPAEVAGLAPRELDELIGTCSFHDVKAQRISQIARRLVVEHGGRLPCHEALLLSLPGVGPKCANLVLAVACGEPRIAVDVHVHRVTNRWGYVRAETPERTAAQLQGKLPRRHWIDLNRLLVPFGKHICTRQRPRCSACPVLDMCRQVGVTSHR